jgi:hypothetical protein
MITILIAIASRNAKYAGVSGVLRILEQFFLALEVARSLIVKGLSGINSAILNKLCLTTRVQGYFSEGLPYNYPQIHADRRG